MKNITAFYPPAILLMFILLIGPTVSELHAFPDPTEHQETPEIQVAEALSKSFRHAAKLAQPSIVSIRMVHHEPKQGEDLGGNEYGNGTGIVVDRTGGILTNYHVIEQAEAVFVELPDGREFPATNIQSDAWSDLALVRISGAGELPEARLGNSDQVDVGDWVVAVGDSFGLGISMNPGTISARHRKLADTNVLLLQTNAATNPGASGGPLLNLRGEVVGINEGAYSMDGGFDGIGFAIPVNVAKFVVTELGTNGFVRWPYLGVSFETLSPAVARQLGMPIGCEGAILTDVARETSASKVGLQVGDVITHFGDQPVTNGTEFQLQIERTPLNRPVEIGFIRNGTILKRSIQLQGKRRIGSVRQADSGSTRDGLTKIGNLQSEVYSEKQLGFSVRDLPAGDRLELGLEEDLEGIYVTEVQPRSAACFQGVDPGSLILRVGTKPVRNLDEFKSAMRKRSPKENTLLLVYCPCCGTRFVVLNSHPPILPVRAAVPLDQPSE